MEHHPPIPNPAQTCTHGTEAGEINSDLNVLSWCVSVVKASVNLQQQENDALRGITAACVTARACGRFISHMVAKARLKHCPKVVFVN